MAIVVSKLFSFFLLYLARHWNSFLWTVAESENNLVRCGGDTRRKLITDSQKKYGRHDDVLRIYDWGENLNSMGTLLPVAAALFNLILN